MFENKLGLKPNNIAYYNSHLRSQNHVFMMSWTAVTWQIHTDHVFYGQRIIQSLCTFALFFYSLTYLNGAEWKSEMNSNKIKPYMMSVIHWSLKMCIYNAKSMGSDYVFSTKGWFLFRAKRVWPS